MGLKEVYLYFVMQINERVIQNVQKAGARLLAVTKYLTPAETYDVLEQLENDPAFLALGENRREALEKKNIPREKVHFIGNLQSRVLPDIAERVSVIHSLCSLKHAEILNEMNHPPAVFIQVNISGEDQKQGVVSSVLPDFVSELEQYKNLRVLGISAIGAGVFSLDEKREEFSRLKKLRDMYFPGKKISAGTSRDYLIALEEGIDIVRVGTELFSSQKTIV